MQLRGAGIERSRTVSHSGGRRRSRREADVVAGSAELVVNGFHPVRSRWTWQPRLPELWLRENEGRQFREMMVEKKEKN